MVHGMSRGRPKSDDKRASIFQVRFTADERAAFDLLIEAWSQEVADVGASVSGSSIIRMLVMREVKARGLDKPRKKGTKR